jgi:arylsulfatase A-like enzyme
MRTLTIILSVSLFLVSCAEKKSRDRLPNIIFILADDLGYGDPSCFGQEKFTTPHIDRLAAEGMMLTQHYSGSTVCAPSRSTIMTGQHTGHTPIRGNREVQPEGQWPLPDASITIAELLKEKGYVTGAFGKWGLGGPGSEGDPNMQGFDRFFGYNCQRKAHNYYPYYLWDNQNMVMLEGNEGQQTGVYAPELIHEKAIEFIDSNKDRPFFLYYPNVIPHAELFAPESYMEKYRGKYLPEKSFEGVDDGPRFRDGPYGSQPESHAAFAAMVNVLDDQVGEVIQKLKDLGLDENTLVIFSSDNGPHLEAGADPDYFNSNGIYRGYKRDLYEGGIRVPTIAWWPGTIEAGTRSDHMSAFWDLYPTLAELTGAEVHDSIDGISFLPVLLGEKGQAEHDYLYWEFHERRGRQALRKGDWKLVRYDVLIPESMTTELYNIAEDPSETMDLAEKHPDIVEELSQLMAGARVDSEVYTFQARR